MTTKVVNIKNKEYYDVFIGRPSIWGNPFIIGKHGNREQVIAKYREWILKRPDLMAQLHTLRGKRLGCYCAPLHCHGHVLAELADTKEAA